MQRLAKGAKRVDGVVSCTYSQLEQTDPTVLKRKFFCTEVDSLKQEVESLDETVQPSWTKIWGRPNANKSFISKLALSLTGEESLRPELNLSEMTDETVNCFMLLTSANKKEMTQAGKIIQSVLPEYHIKVLNGDYTTNKSAEDETKKEIAIAQRKGKAGVIVISNQMGSRSYGVSEIQATVIAYDRGSVDATTQKVSRCLNPGVTYDNEDRTHGFIVDMSFNPNRSENIERLVIEEAVTLMRSENIDFVSAITYVLTSIDLFRINEYGIPVEVDEVAMFNILGDNDTLLRIADVSVDVKAALASGLFDILHNVNTGSGKQTGKDDKIIVGENVQNSVTHGGIGNDYITADLEHRDLEKVMNKAIRALNMSATSVYDLANGGTTYRECLQLVSHSDYAYEFTDLFGVAPSDVETLLDEGVLNELILDVIVQNSQNIVDSPFI